MDEHHDSAHAMSSPAWPDSPAERGASSWLTEAELNACGFRHVGAGVRISRRASFHLPGAISIGDAVRIDDFCVLTGGSGVEIGNFVHIGCFCALFGGSGISLGDFSGLSPRVTIFSESEDYSGRTMTNPTIPARYRTAVTKGKVELMRHVIVGAGSTILPGIVLEEGAAVGAHSLVTKRCQAWWTYFGAPAKRLRRRSRELLEQERDLLRTRHGRNSGS